MLTLITMALFITAVVTGNAALSCGLMIWFLIVGLKSITYILRWNKKKNTRRKAFTAHLTACQAAEEAERRVKGHDIYRIIHPERPEKKQHIEKEPPRKGTKRWNKEQQKMKNRKRRLAIRNVLDIIDSLDSSYSVRASG